jgi:phage/conjugal plasmid C-4 type zinc finger TraR family protein
MSDVLDLAQRHEQFRRELALRAVRAGAEELATPAAFGLCDDCSDLIDAERRKALPGARRCLFCQEAFERRLRTHSGAQ